MTSKERKKRKIVLNNVAGNSATAIAKAAVSEGIAVSAAANLDGTYNVTFFNIPVSRALALLKSANDGDGQIPE